MSADPVYRSNEDPDELDLADFDLNLLIVLSSLLRCKNITHAGNELRLSQPATSRALTRLREIFEDELLVRRNRSFELTPLAESLIPKVADALGNIDRVFSNHVIAPERFSVAMPDHIALFLAARLTAYFKEISPTTVFLPVLRLTNVLTQIESGGADLALGVADDAPPGFFCRALPPIPTLCLAKKGHPAVSGNVSYPDLGRFLSVRIGSSYNTGFGEVYDGIEALRPRGRETITVPDIHTAARLLQGTDAVLVLPEPSARHLAASFDLASFVPRKGPALPPYQISLIWHEKSHRNGIHSGVRSMVAGQVIEGAKRVSAQ